jgi:hypothetical protein
LFLLVILIRKQWFRFLPGNDEGFRFHCPEPATSINGRR